MSILASDNIIKAFIPDDQLIWMAADIIKEVAPGQFDVEITDVDFRPTTANPARRVINMRAFVGLTALPLHNEGMGDNGVDDMTTLNFLHEASILDNLRRRFAQHLPYTYTGEICIAVSVCCFHVCVLWS